jgi:hypothetical protein
MWTLTRAAALAAVLGMTAAPEISNEDDPRVRAFLAAYEALVDSVAYGEEDVIFFVGGERIHLQDGRMLAADRLARAAECDPIFYRYPLGPLMEIPPPPPVDLPTYCPDLLESLWGSTEVEIRRHGRSARFLDHRMFVNHLLIEPLAAVEAELRRVAAWHEEVAAWIEGLEITYSFVSRDIAGSENRSHHAWGLAVDFVPTSYGGRAVYWRWSRALDREGWARIPLEERWTPPHAVVAIFERHGFVWGGKWSNFDNIHFEYRPEILGYNRLVRAER